MNDSKSICYLCHSQTVGYLIIAIRNIIFILTLSVFCTFNLKADNLEKVDSPYFKVFHDTNLIKALPNLVFVIWDSVNLNPYRKIGVERKTDSTLLELVDNENFFTPPFKGKVTSGYGYRGGHYHPAVDIDLDYGDTVLCVFSGVVRVSCYYKGYGNYVIVTHNNGLETMYAHLSKNLVRTGQYLHSGDIVGLGGATGRASGTHLHFEVRFMGYPINPNNIIDFDNYCMKCNSYTICSQTFGSTTASSYSASSSSNVKTNSGETKYHVVKQGDTLYRISKLYGVSIEKLCSLNHISKTTLLQLGWKIKYQ